MFILDFQEDAVDIPALLLDAMAQQDWEKVRQAYLELLNRYKFYGKNDNLVIND